MAEHTTDPLWDGEGADAELEELQALFSPLKTQVPPPELPDRPGALPVWLLPLAAAILLLIGAGALRSFISSVTDDSETAAQTDLPREEATGAAVDGGDEGVSRRDDTRRDTPGPAPTRGRGDRRSGTPPAPKPLVAIDDSASTVGGGASAAVQLLWDLAGNVHYPQVSPDGERIAFEVNYPAEKRTELYTADLTADGAGDATLMVPESGASAARYGGARRVTHMLGWAPPGGKYDYAYTVSDADGSQAIYVDGWSALLDEGVNKEPTWDPTTSRFVFTSNRTGNGDLYLWDAGVELQLTFDEVHAEIYPAWAPQGDKVAFVRAGKGESQIMVLEVNMFSSMQLFSFPGKDSTRPSFSPDGSKVAFLSNKATDSVMQFGLWVVDARPGSTPRNIGPNVRIPTKGACSWTPDGKGVIAVIDDPDRGDPIAIFPIDGGAPRILETGTVNNRDPQLFQRDESWTLAFASQGRVTKDEKTWTRLFFYDIPR